MATLTKKDLLEAIEDMPMDADIIIECEDGYTEARKIECYKNNKIYMLTEKDHCDFIALVKRMREAQEELDVFEYEHDFFEYEVIMKRKELTSKVIKLESKVDEYLKKMKI